MFVLFLSLSAAAANSYASFFIGGEVEVPVNSSASLHMLAAHTMVFSQYDYYHCEIDESVTVHEIWSGRKYYEKRLEFRTVDSHNESFFVNLIFCSDTLQNGSRVGFCRACSEWDVLWQSMHIPLAVFGAVAGLIWFVIGKKRKEWKETVDVLSAPEILVTTEINEFDRVPISRSLSRGRRMKKE
jgi:hypothetical protein